jgi:hypothetical protein
LPYISLQYEPALLDPKPNPRFKRSTVLAYKYPMPKLLIAFMSLVALTLPIMAVAALTMIGSLL